MAILSQVWGINRTDKQVMAIDRTTVHRTLDEITVRVYDKSAGVRMILRRAEMLLRPGERMKLLTKRYPLYVYAVRKEEDNG